ncbi:MAG TPA: hypothetical protein VF279_07610, partial [Acidimicrobiales bacterium]
MTDDSTTAIATPTATATDDSTTAIAGTIGSGPATHPPPAVAPNTGVTVSPVQSPRSRMIERTIGILALVGTVATVWLGIWVTPPDKTQGDL